MSNITHQPYPNKDVAFGYSRVQEVDRTDMSLLNDWEQQALRNISFKVCKEWNLSGKQIALWHRLHLKAQGQAQEPQKAQEAAFQHYPKIRAFLEHAALKLQRPKMTVGALQIKKAPINGSNPQSYYVTFMQNGVATYQGAIHADAAFAKTRGAHEHICTYLNEIEQDPTQAVLQSIKTREAINCCFCSKDLTNGESRLRGYGPTCAENYNMPYDYDKADKGREQWD